MSTIIILTPIVIAGWPSIVAATVGAAAALGLSVGKMAHEETTEALTETQKQGITTAEVELDESRVVAQSMGSQKEIVVSKGDVELRVKRDTRGRCVVSATGKGKSKAELVEIAESFAGKVTQVYTYNKVMGELHAKGMKIANEEVTADQSIRINVRNEEN
jgi:hypothetical protein